jgi:hypothetical protein
MPEPTLEEQAEALDGLYIDMLDRWEYQHLLDAGVLTITNDRAAQFLGTARLRRVDRDTGDPPRTLPAIDTGDIIGN